METVGDSGWYDIAVDSSGHAFRKMFEHYYPAMCVYAGRYIRSTAVCEDIAQEILSAVWLNRCGLDYSIPARQYLTAAVRNRCLNYLRNRPRERYEELSSLHAETIPYSDDSDSMLMIHELETLLAEALAKLPEAYRIAFEMSQMQHRPLSEIAGRLGISVRTVERYRDRAIELLKTELKDYILLFALLYRISG
ncbi:MAG: RNA polymerase sigma-70 factor [Tannerella sp.]|nr:RNA polymerase sigma-70 factor [Tannerella sp.]